MQDEYRRHTVEDECRRHTAKGGKTGWLGLIIAILAIAALVGWFVVDHALNGDYKAMKSLLEMKVESAARYERAMLAEDGAVTEGEVKAVREALAEGMTTKQKMELTIAAIACVDKGFPEELAREMAMSMFDIPIEQIWVEKPSWSEVDALTLLNFIGAENFTADMYSHLYSMKVIKDGSSVCDWIAALPAAQLLKVYDGLMDGWQGKPVFESLMVVRRSEAELESCLTELTEQERWRFLRIYGSHITDADEVLAFIRFVRRMGVSLRLVYPQGAAIDLKTAHCRIDNGASGAMPEGPFLVMTRTEKREPYERLDEPPVIGYEGNASRGDAAFTVTLDMDALEKMPEELIPQTMADCAAWVFLDTEYVSYGYLIGQREYTPGSMVSVYVPTYAAVDRVAVYDARSGECCLILAWKMTLPPELPGKNVDAQEYYSAQSDRAWLTRQKEALLDQLAQHGFDLQKLDPGAYAD